MAIDKRHYQIVKLGSDVDAGPSRLPFRGASKMGPGFILAPYRTCTYDELKPRQQAAVRKQRGKWAKYREQHKACPKCGGTHISQTLVGYMNPPDLNRADCHTTGCGWRGKVDDLVPPKEN